MTGTSSIAELIAEAAEFKEGWAQERGAVLAMVTPETEIHITKLVGVMDIVVEMFGKFADALSAPGWKLVPAEITPEMQRAYFNVIDKNLPRVETDPRFGRHSSNTEAYRAMLAAAPSYPPLRGADPGRAGSETVQRGDESPASGAELVDPTRLMEGIVEGIISALSDRPWVAAAMTELDDEDRVEMKTALFDVVERKLRGRLA